MPDSYGGASIDITAGKGTASPSAARVPNNSSSNNNRHCTAHEQCSAAINKICDALEILGYGDTAPIRKDIADALMKKNTGE